MRKHRDTDVDQDPGALVPRKKRRRRIVSTSLSSSEVSALLTISRAPHTPTPTQVLEAGLAIRDRVDVNMSEEEVLEIYLNVFETLFAGRRFVVELVPSLIDTEETAPQLTRRAARRYQVAEDIVSSSGVRLVDQYQPTFEDAGDGFDIPLISSGRVLGVLGVEYWPEQHAPIDDFSLLGVMAIHLGDAVGNARLRRESTYLRDHLSTILDHANVPIAVVDRRRRIRLVSTGFMAITGQRREGLVGRDFTRLLPEPERSRFMQTFVNVLNGESLTDLEIRLPKRDGTLARVTTSMTPILDPDGEVDGMLVIGRDITEVRDLREQVIHAEKLATLGQLAAGVVHELNNPLTSISVYSEFLLKKAKQENSAAGDVEKLRRIVQSSDRILRFTRDLVAYARPASEAPTSSSITELLDQALVFCEHLIDGCGAHVDRRYEGELTKVNVVRGQMHQVFINLITNACHAMPDGAGYLAIEAEEVENAIEVRMIDNGKGVPADQVGSIFEPFFSTKGEGKGTGLGLSIVRNIVQQHGGTIEVTSVIGQGAIFTIAIPLSDR